MGVLRSGLPGCAGDRPAPEQMRWGDLGMRSISKRKHGSSGRERTKAEIARMGDRSQSWRWRLLKNALVLLIVLFPASGRGAAPSGWSGPAAALNRLAPVAPWHLHDLRRTAATNMASLGVVVNIVAKILNHADREVTGILIASRARTKEGGRCSFGRALARRSSVTATLKNNVISLHERIWGTTDDIKATSGR